MLKDVPAVCGLVIVLIVKLAKAAGLTVNGRLEPLVVVLGSVAVITSPV